MSKRLVIGLTWPDEFITHVKEEAKKHNSGNCSAYTEKMIRIGMQMDREFNRRFDLLEQAIIKLHEVNIDANQGKGKDGKPDAGRRSTVGL